MDIDEHKDLLARWGLDEQAIRGVVDSRPGGLRGMTQNLIGGMAFSGGERERDDEATGR